MITTLPPYPAYKDSGVPWLGKVPEHWEVLPGHGCFVERKQPNIGLMETTVLSLSYGRIVVKPEDKLRGLVPASFETYQIVDPGDIVCCPTDLQNDQNSLRFGLVRNRGIITSAYMTFRTTGRLDSNYGYLLLHAYDVKKIFYGLGSGLRQNLDWRDFKRLPCLVPPLPEQTAIVRFLDYMDRRIRRFIRAKQKLIKLLEEYRQALIHQAVTGKIDVRTGKPYPSCKDSGVPWLVKVPEHWEVVPLRWFISIASGDFIETSAVSGNRSNERPYPVIGGNGVLGYAGLYNATEITVVVGRVGALCGNVHIVNEPAWITDNALMITQIIEFSPKFLSIQLKVMDLNRLANANAQPLVTGGMIKAQRVVKPLIHEQLAIVDFVDEQTAKLDAAIAAARREIELLREYRERLIADVVTGKVDVRGVAAQLPEEPPDQEAGTEEEEPVADELATVDSQEEANGEE